MKAEHRCPRGTTDGEKCLLLIFVIFSKLRKSHLILLHVLILQEEPEPQQCTNEHHNFYTENYKDESNCKFCKNSWLEGQQCTGCKKQFLSEKLREGDFKPCESASSNIFLSKLQGPRGRKKGRQQGEGPWSDPFFCNNCYKNRLSMCAKDTPRSKQNR